MCVVARVCQAVRVYFFSFICFNDACEENCDASIRVVADAGITTKGFVKWLTL